MTTKRAPVVLIVDDDARIGYAIGRLLLRAGLGIQVTQRVEDALPYVAGCDLAITDWDMGCASGLEFIERARRLRPDVPILVMSASLEAREAADRLGIAFVMKSWDGRGVVDVIRRITSFS